MLKNKNNKRILTNLLLITLIITNLSACGPLIIASAASGVAVLTDRRTTGTYIEDQAIELKAFKYLNENEVVSKHSNISVTSYNERVLLTGTATNNLVKNQIEDIIKTIPKVKTIYNEIQIASEDQFKSSAYDTWLTTKIKTKLTTNGSVNPLDIKVHTNNQIVYLMGLVHREEAEAATDIARKADGVTKVVRLFEYIEPNNNSSSQYAYNN